MSRRSEHSIAGIYTITNTVSGTVYVGQARNIRKRWEVHRSTLRSGSHRNCYLQRAWNKYGEGAFAFEVHLDLSLVSLASLSDALNEAEIKVLGAFTETYNLMEAGFSGTVASDKTRALLSAQRKALWANAAFRKKRSEAARALHADPNFKAQHSAAVSAGLRTPEAKEKRSKLSKQLWRSESHREKQSRMRATNWQDPAYRQQQVESRKAAWRDPDVRAKRITALQAASADPTVRASRSAGLAKVRDRIAASQREKWRDPEYRAKQHASRSEGQSRRFQDSSAKARHAEIMRQSWARRKATTAYGAPPLASREGE